MNTEKIGFIGGGNMASCLMTGLIQSGFPAENIWVSDIAEQLLQKLKDNLNINTTTDNVHLAEHVDVVVLAVKPQVLREAAEQIASTVQQKQSLVVSIAAGINQKSLKKWLGERIPIVRTMPNTPALVMSAVTALHANEFVSDAGKQLAENILRAVGITLWVESESELDAVTAVSGSGPAYFFLLMEAMEWAAVELGLNEDIARILVQQTALGAAKIALEAEESPAQLRQRVTSPNGTTEKALEVFEQGEFKQLVSKALHAARDRSIEMSKELGEK
jgi:pyrroline-5-carboxylate reductase